MGRWETKNTDYTSYLESKVANCELCGKMIPKEMWISEINGEDHHFCNQECEAMYLSYWLPKYGRKS